MGVGMENNPLYFGKENNIIFDYNCDICGKYTENQGYRRFPVIYKLTKERIYICETCLSFIKDNGKDSSFEVV